MENYVIVSEAAKVFLDKHGISIDYENGNFFMSPEDSKPYWNFVVKGLVENYFIDEKGNKRIKWFTADNQLFLGTKHLHSKNNDNVFIKFVRPTLCIQISNERMIEAKNKFPEISELINILREQFSKRQKKHIEVLQTPGCTPQVKKFKKHFPTLFNMLTPDQLADHLNQSLATIYRALADIYNRNK